MVLPVRSTMTIEVVQLRVVRAELHGPGNKKEIFIEEIRFLLYFQYRLFSGDEKDSPKAKANHP